MFKAKSKQKLTLLLTLFILLCGCSKQEAPQSSDSNVTLPNPTPQLERNVAGIEQLNTDYDVTLHYVSQNALTLSTVTRSIELAQNENLIERALKELFDAATLSGMPEARIDRLEIGSGIVNVNLSMETRVNRSEQDYLLLCASIANTLLQFEGVEAVNVLCGDRSIPLCGLPTGAFVDSQDNIAALYAQAQSEAERSGGENSGILHNALLYFPSQDGKYLLSEVRELDFHSENYALDILRALSDGALMRACGDTPLPGNLEFLDEAPLEMITENGERVIELRFSEALINYLDFTGMETWQLYGSVTLSLCSFVPELDAVRFYIGDQIIGECSVNGHAYVFEDGLMRRSDFTSAIGSSVNLYFASGEKQLSCVEVPIPRGASALDLLRELVSAQPREDLNLRSVFPEGITPNDILGMELNGQTATINLSANFYACCQSMRANEERQMIYAMVNTLASLDGIDSVSFLLEGKPIDSLSQNIYLGVPLLPDPGMSRIDVAVLGSDN